MSTALNILGLTQEQAAKTEVASISEGFKPLPSGIYNGNIVQIGTFKTDSGATQFKIVVKVKDGRELTKYGNYLKKDGSINEYGQRDVMGALNATKIDLSTIQAQTIKTKCYGKEKDFNNFIGLEKAPVSVFVREVFEEGSQYEEQNEIEGIFDEDCKNSNGEDQSEKFTQKIEKKPVLRRKAKAQSGGSAKTAAAKGAGSVVSRL
jgi:hypothetical protein